jgi:F0F1-type ATP synthase membrane subunit b/b'
MSKFQDTLKDAQARAKAFEADARKFAETLQDRAQAELKSLLKLARESSREQAFQLGVELEKLGKALQQRATQPTEAPVVDSQVQ